MGIFRLTCHRSSRISWEDASRQPREACQRHPNPTRPVGGLVSNLVGHFFDQKEVKERAASSISANACGIPISPEECCRNPCAELRDELIPLSFVHRHGTHAFSVTQGCA